MERTGSTVRLSNLVDADGKITGLRATDCTILGPAVVLADGGEITGCAWEGPPDAVVWEIDPRREAIVGAIILINCVFVGCTFRMVGFAGTPEAVRELYENSTV